MRGGKAFVDTNVLVYAYDAAAGAKHAAARDLLADLWESGAGAISVQVLQEFFVTVTRKIPEPLPVKAARGILADLAEWTVVAPDAKSVLRAVDLQTERGLSFWDAMVVVTALDAGAKVLYTEDLQAGARIGGVEVRNPFA